MKDGLINEGENEMNLLKKNLSSAQVTDPRTTRMVRFEPCHMYDMDHIIWSRGQRIPLNSQKRSFK